MADSMKAYELLADPKAWLHGGGNARDAEGNAVSLTDPKAVRFCVGAAVLRCHPENGLSKLAILRREIGSFTWNDKPERTHADIIELLRRHDL